MSKDPEQGYVTINVKLFKPFHAFLKTYLQFFGSDTPLDLFLTVIVNEKVCQLYKQLETLVHERDMLLEPKAWFEKWPDIACSSFEETDEPYGPIDTL